MKPSINPSAFHILTPLSFWSYSGYSYTVSFFYPSVQEKLHKPGKKRVRWVSQNYRRNCNAIKIHIDPGTKVPFLTVENRLEFLKILMDLYKPPHNNTGEPSTLINQALQHHREIPLSVDKRPGMGGQRIDTWVPSIVPVRFGNPNCANLPIISCVLLIFMTWCISTILIVAHTSMKTPPTVDLLAVN